MTRGRGLLAAVLFPLLLAGVIYALLLPHNGSGAQQVQAQFADADLLVPGDDVEMNGTRIGTIADVGLTDHGTALVTMNLSMRVPVHTDASASIQQADLFGDVYLALDPGTSGQLSHGPIAESRTFVATQLQNVFDTFSQPTRVALQSLIVELGTALYARGADLNQAVLQLSPAVAEANRIAAQLGSQNANLQELITSARRLTTQLAPRSRDVGRLIGGLDRTLQITAARAAPLGSGLQSLPATLTQTHTTLRDLQDAATAATPLAAQLGAIAPALTTVVGELAPFTSDAKPALVRLAPLLSLTATTLQRSAHPIAALGPPISQLGSITPSLGRLASILYPVIGIGLKGVFGGLGGLAAEPGSDGRNQFRAQLVLGCEMYGIPTHPGCLTEALDAGQTKAATSRPARKAPAQPVSVPAATTTTAPATPSPLPAPRPLPPTVSGVLHALGGVLGTATHRGGPAGSPPKGTTSPIGPLLKYLLGP